MKLLGFQLDCSRPTLALSSVLVPQTLAHYKISRCHNTMSSPHASFSICLIRDFFFVSCDDLLSVSFVNEGGTSITVSFVLYSVLFNF